MKGKEKCKALKQIRQKIAEQNDIAYAVSECTFQGECKGTCPKCEAELRYLERELAIRKNLGKAVVVAGISAGICAPMTSCAPLDMVSDFISSFVAEPEVLEGDTEYVEPQLTGDMSYEEQQAIDGYVVPEDVSGSEDFDSDDYNKPDELVGEIYIEPESSEENGTSEEEFSEDYILEGDVDYVEPEENSEDYILEGEMPLAEPSEE